jgi:hypothetical protein
VKFSGLLIGESVQMGTSGKKKRSNGSVSFGAVLAFVLLLIGIAFFALSMFMGGQNETKNATDAGMLNVGKKVVDEVSVPLYPTPNEIIFADVCNNTSNGEDLLASLTGGLSDLGEINLHRINRVWAKALQIAINAEAADREGFGGTGKQNAQKAFEGAESISNRLADKLAEKGNLYAFFDELAAKNSVRMLGSDATTKSLKGNNWQSALLSRGRESNITVAPPEYSLPPNFQFPGLVMKSSRKNVPSAGKDLYFLSGYTPIKLADKTFWQVPFVYDETPHMVSGTEFGENTLKAKPIEEWKKPLPNAFSGEGIAESKSGKAGQKAISWVLTNPGQNFKMSIPHSFVRIKVDEMMCDWYFFPVGPQTRVKYGDSVKYGYKPEEKKGPRMPLGGAFCLFVEAGTVELGLDVLARNLDQIIFGIPDEDNEKIEAYLVNRANEMIGKPGKVITVDNLHDTLSNPLTILYLLADQREFYLFSADGESLEIMPKYLALIKAPWLALKYGEEPDGTEMKLVDDADCPAALLNKVSAQPLPKCLLVPPTPFGWGLWDKDVYWTPGSGYNSCLGNLRVKRWTEVYSLGIAIPSLL